MHGLLNAGLLELRPPLRSTRPSWARPSESAPMKGSDDDDGGGDGGDDGSMQYWGGAAAPPPQTYADVEASDTDVQHHEDSEAEAWAGDEEASVREGRAGRRWALLLLLLLLT